MDKTNTDLSDTNKIEGLLKNIRQDNLIGVLREFGIMGVVTYVGGGIMLILFPAQSDYGKQVLYAISGLFLLFLATLISYFRIKAQSAREKYLIEMVQNVSNRLAEQLSKNLPEKQIDGIIQKIRQLQRDLLAAIFSIPTEK